MMKVSTIQNHNLKLRCEIIGTDFWANYQIAAWLKIPRVQIVALYNRTKNKAEAINEKFGLNATVYDDYEALLKNETINFVDIITDVDSHEMFTVMAAEKEAQVLLLCITVLPTLIGGAVLLKHLTIVVSLQESCAFIQ